MPAPTYRFPQPFEELDHTADVGIRVFGESAPECLARLVLGFTALTLGASGELEADATLALRVEAAEYDVMAVDVLRELLYVFDTELRLPTRCIVHHFDALRGVSLELATLRIDEDTHRDITTLKAVTWHDAKFEPVFDGWHAQVIFDV